MIPSVDIFVSTAAKFSPFQIGFSSTVVNFLMNFDDRFSWLLPCWTLSPSLYCLFNSCNCLGENVSFCHMFWWLVNIERCSSSCVCYLISWNISSKSYSSLDCFICANRFAISPIFWACPKIGDYYTLWNDAKVFGLVKIIDIAFLPFWPLFSTLFNVCLKVVDNAECFCWRRISALHVRLTNK